MKSGDLCERRLVRATQNFSEFLVKDDNIRWLSVMDTRETVGISVLVSFSVSRKNGESSVRKKKCKRVLTVVEGRG